MEGVDVDEFRIDRHRALVEGDQHAEREGVHLRHPDRDDLPPLAAQRGAQPLEEAVQIGTHLGIGGDRELLGILEHLDEGGEEVVAPVVELLDEGVRVGAALVAEDIQPLMHLFTIKVERLAEALHHQLLQVAGEQNQPVGIGHDHHVTIPFALSGDIPHRGEHHRRILLRIRGTGPVVHPAGALQEGGEIHPGQRRRNMPDNAGLAGASADRFGHLENREEVVLTGVAVQLALLHRDRGSVAGEGELLRRIEILHRDHVVLRLLGAARLRDHQMEGSLRIHHFEQIGELRRIGVVEEVDFEVAVALRVALLIPVRAVDCELHQLRPERRTADAVDYDRVELFAGLSGDPAGTHLFGKGLNRTEEFAFRIAPAVGEVGDLAVFIGIFDFAGLNPGHLPRRPFEFRRERLQVGLLKFHSGESD